MTNPSAMTALQTLQSINKNLETTQSRISTGYRVAEASDNAAYWSIATTMRSDNSAMSAVTDSLGLGAAQVDVAYTAMDVVKDTLDNLKAKLVTAQQPDIDKGKIQSEIEQLQNNLTTYAESASFSGGNWLNVSKMSVQKIIASFTRDPSGGIQLVAIEIDTSKTALFNGEAGKPGLLQEGVELDDDGGITDLTEIAAVDGVSGAAQEFDTFAPFTLEEGNAIRFNIAVDGGQPVTVTIDRSTVAAALGNTTGAINTVGDYVDVVEQALADAGVTGVTVGLNPPANDAVVITSDEDDADVSGLAITGARSSTNGNFNQFDATTFDITEATVEELDMYMRGLDSMLSRITTAASDLGSIKNRIEKQQVFVGMIMDAIERGIGQLVDADMNYESTRLQALQVQQQLGIQALTIANTNAQNILSLFR